MGCNCSKNKTRPLPSAPTRSSTNSTTSKPWYSPRAGTSFTVETPGGTQTYGSKLEADAAARRFGGTVTQF